MLSELGSLTNSGTMPIDAGGGAAAPSAVRGENRIGGATNGNIQFAQSPWKILTAVGVVGALIWWGTKK